MFWGAIFACCRGDCTCCHRACHSASSLSRGLGLSGLVLVLLGLRRGVMPLSRVGWLLVISASTLIVDAIFYFSEDLLYHLDMDLQYYSPLFFYL